MLIFTTTHHYFHYLTPLPPSMTPFLPSPLIIHYSHPNPHLCLHQLSKIEFHQQHLHLRIHRHYFINTLIINIVFLSPALFCHHLSFQPTIIYFISTFITYHHFRQQTYSPHSSTLFTPPLQPSSPSLPYHGTLRYLLNTTLINTFPTTF